MQTLGSVAGWPWNSQPARTCRFRFSSTTGMHLATILDNIKGAALDADKIVEAARRQGWRVEEKKKGRMLYPPDKAKSQVLWHNTPSDVRAVRNFLSLMRRSGLEWPPSE